MGACVCGVSCSRRFEALALSAFVVVGCSSAAATFPAIDMPAANEIDSADPESADEWTTFAHDYARTGDNQAVTRLNRSTVAKLRLRWKQRVGDTIFASPVTYAGNVIVATEGLEKPAGSVVYDFRASDGRLLWQFRMGGETWATPTIDPDAGLVIVAPNERVTCARRSLPYDSSTAALHGVNNCLAACVGRSLPADGSISARREATSHTVCRAELRRSTSRRGASYGGGASILIPARGVPSGARLPTTGRTSSSERGTRASNRFRPRTARSHSHSRARRSGRRGERLILRCRHGRGVMLDGGLAHFINKNGRFYALNQETGDLAWYADLNRVARHPHEMEWRFCNAVHRWEDDRRRRRTL